MSLSDEVSYFSRFWAKFVEIIAAGLATAVSGYLIAHLSGALSSPTPAPTGAPVQVAPSPTTVSNTLPTQSTVPTADSNEQRLAPPQTVSAPAVAQPAPPQREVNAPAVAQPPRSGVNAARSTPLHKQTEAPTSVVESKRDQQSFVARVRAALGNTGRTESLDAPAHQNDVARGPAAKAASTVADTPAALAAAPSSATEVRPVPAPQAPVELNSPTAIEIKSRPVPAIESAPAPAPEKETGVLSGLEEILRHDPLAGSNDAPRPPLPVGQ
jgi:hypothetical protein